MIIKFTGRTSWFFENNDPLYTNGKYWSRIFKAMRDESNLDDRTAFDSVNFAKYLRENWNIVMLYDQGNIAGVELPEETLSMLLLRFPTGQI